MIKDGGLGCYDCGIPTCSYMVKNEIWHKAMPEYVFIKKALRAKYHKTAEPTVRVRSFVCLCLECLSVRLQRSLTLDDFDLTLPINQGIAFGYWLGSENAKNCNRKCSTK